MKKNTVFDKMLFGMQLALFLVKPFVIWWSTTPTNILNSNYLFKLLEIVGIFGAAVTPLGIPAGIIGIIMAKRMIEFRKATLILSIINLVVGAIAITMGLVLLCAVLFGGISV